LFLYKSDAALLSPMASRNILLSSPHGVKIEETKKGPVLLEDFLLKVMLQKELCTNLSTFNLYLFALKNIHVDGREIFYK
jgi:hypothetical protein